MLDRTIPSPIRRWAASAIALAALCHLCPLFAADGKTKTFTAGTIKLTVPAAWIEKPTRPLQLALYVVPKVEGDAADAEFAVYHFGGPGGGIAANVRRWVNQFVEKDRKVKMVRGKSPDGEYVLVDLQGTWKKPVGPPIQQRTVEMPHARVLGVILTVKDEGNFFLRLTGGEKTVSRNADAFRASFAADSKSEKPYQVSEE